MSLILAESFDNPNPTQKSGYSTVSGGTVNSTAGRNGNGFGNTASAQPIIRYDLASSEQDDYVVVGVALFLDTLGTFTLFQFSPPGSSSLDVRLRVNSTGTLTIVNAASADIASSAVVLNADTWYYIEFAARKHDTAGTAQAWVNGTSVVSATGIDTLESGTKFGRISILGSPGVENNTRLDEFYILNEEGSTFNSRLGDVRIAPIDPTGNGNSSGMTGSDGNSIDNYLLVNDESDATYVEHATAGTEDTYVSANLPTTSFPVLGVQVWGKALTDAGPKKLAFVARSGTSESDSADISLSTIATWYQATFATKPGGGSWSGADVDAAEFGVKARD